ncbi:hypothetical protein [Mesorhizobium sophorae]|uniref:hypothetical protein n=1 Tax=Mesorhizobium sophorae TaxID=1300294 RepID=UPI00117E2966|nr:hypothetical protein [Mesorhizobium sophorae]
MLKLTSSQLIWFALRASTALALTTAPYQLSLHAVAKIGPAVAYAKSEGGHGGGGDGHGGDSGSGGNSGSGGGDDGGNSGSGGGEDGGADDHGGDDHGADDHGADDRGADDNGADDNGHHGQEHVNSAGDKVEVEGNKIEVTHPDGVKEEIENGRLDTKDATGRTIAERAATPADFARLQGL